METSHVLAQYIVDAKYEGLPPEVIEVTKKSILDTIGVILAATTLGEGRVEGIVDLVREGGGKQESTILGFGDKVPCWMAALANGAMAHQLDYDDCYDAGIVHPGGATVSAALAVAERQGNVRGQDFITAVALGADVVCRLSLPLKRGSFEYGWNRAGTFGKYGATAAAGKLLGLNRPQMVNAFGIVLNQATISNESAYAEGSHIRGIRDGFCAQAGILSALLAQKGVIGDQNNLDGKYGFYNICWLGDSDPAIVTADLGKKFLGADVSLKPWPCCRNVHGHVEAALCIMKEHGLRPEDIVKIIVVTGGMRQSYYETIDERRKPKTSIDAMFSLPFVMGVAIARGWILLEDFTLQGRDNPVALEVAQKVTYKLDKKYQRAGIEIGLVEVVTKEGRRYRKEVPFAYGHPQNPISKEDLFKKFKDCAQYSVRPLPRQRINEVIETLYHLEEIEDVRKVIRLMV